MNRIYIDARVLASHEFRGTAKHLISIIENLPDQEFILLSNKRINSEILNSSNISSIVFGFNNYFLWEQISLPFFLLFNKEATVIFPNHTMPFFYFGKKIFIIHDFIFLLNIKLSRFYTRIWLASIYRTACVFRALYTKSTIITVSNSTYNRINKYNKLKNKVLIVYNKFEKPILHEDANRILDKPYILSVSGNQPHKNCRALIKAFSKVERDIKLVIVGARHLDFTDLDISKVIFLCGIPNHILYNLYRNCKLFIFPSLEEGFGIPLLEAAYFKCVLLCSDIDVFHEICGKNAIYFNPNSEEEIINCIYFALNNDALQFSEYENSFAEKAKVQIQSLLKWI